MYSRATSHILTPDAIRAFKRKAMVFMPADEAKTSATTPQDKAKPRQDDDVLRVLSHAYCT